MLGGFDRNRERWHSSRSDSPRNALEYPLSCNGAWRCSENGYTLTLCENGDWNKIDCMKERARLCEQGHCVMPARYGAPVWSACEDDPHATEETLAQKAEYYKEIMGRYFGFIDEAW